MLSGEGKNTAVVVLPALARREKRSMMKTAKRGDTLPGKVDLPDNRDKVGGDNRFVPRENAIYDLALYQRRAHDEAIVKIQVRKSVGIHNVGFHNKSSGILYSAALISS
jgi:hypothetical protein